MAGTLTLADYDGLQVNASRETIGPMVKVDRASSGVEVRTVWNPAGVRYRYRVQIIAQEVNDEATDLATFVNDQYLMGDSFTLANDPVTGTSVTVRFDAPPRFEQYRISGWWSVTLDMVSVL